MGYTSPLDNGKNMAATFKRKIYQELLAWKRDLAPRYALLVEGARRIGKSTVVENFARREYDSYVLIDFSTAPREIRGLFADVSDLDFIFMRIQLQYGVQLKKGKSLVIFDEVQFCPKARQAIKALVKDGRFHYLETGSLISIKRNVGDILIPSEEKKVTMHPLDYEEFRWALGDADSPALLREVFLAGKGVGDAANRKLMRDFRLYMLVGGMPQAVEEYLRSGNLRRVDEVKRGIIGLYEDDFRKIDGTGVMSQLFDAIPAQLNSHASRFQVSSVVPARRAADVRRQLAELKESHTVLMAYHANDPAAGLSAGLNPDKFKMFLGDTGLFVTLAFKDREFTENVIYEKLLADKLPANLGYLYENIVAQTLAAKGDRLAYYTFPNETTRHNYEVDFIVARQDKICPVEVKSSAYRAHASIDAFQRKFSGRIRQRYLVHPKDIRRDGDIICLPFYLVQFL